MRIILYSKPGCHLCEGLQEKLEQIVQKRSQSVPLGAAPSTEEGNNFASLQLEIRDITTRKDWFQAYQYEVPVLYITSRSGTEEEGKERPLPRPSPRATVEQLENMLQKYL
ncbi:glutaredoxin family protein [Mastigocladopsis repens]|uniref:glutaredoxin family protein n=1 Tax=Mastigocladopsis repens TaxID=221287 RepID=UPI000382750B|nr:glutaredoxin family protein [Mastigocladopsis repens]